MFEIQKLISTERPIALQTKLGNDIDNSVALPPDAVALRKHEFMRSRFGGNWVTRRLPYGECNCAGLVWANRRTAIREDKIWIKILQEDGYRKLPEGEEPKLGDIVVYSSHADPLSEPDNKFYHVGIVFELQNLDLSGASLLSNQKTPWILSKWNDVSGEYMHHFNHIENLREYDDGVVCQYWTDRPSSGENNNEYT